MKSLIAVFLLFFSFVNLNAQTADDVIAKYLEAVGGVEKLRTVKSVYTEAVAVMQNGFEINSKIYKVQDKLFRQEIDFGRGSMTTIVTEKEGWFTNPRNNGEFEALPADAIIAQQSELDIFPLLDYTTKGSKADLIGKETIDGVEAYNIKLTTKGGKQINYYIDNKNWYIIRTSTKGGGMGAMFGGGGGQGRRQAGEEVEMKVDFLDYKKTSEGLIFPMTTARPAMGGEKLKSSIEKIEINKTVDPKLYKPE